MGALDKDEEQQSNNQVASDGTGKGVELRDIPCARIESVQENQVAHSLNAVQLREYCSKLFHFKVSNPSHSGIWITGRITCRIQCRNIWWISSRMDYESGWQKLRLYLARVRPART